MGRMGNNPSISLAPVVTQADTSENAVIVFDLIDELVRKKGTSNSGPEQV